MAAFVSRHRRYLRLFALGRRCEPDLEAGRRARRAVRVAGTFFVGSGLTAGP